MNRLPLLLLALSSACTGDLTTKTNNLTTTTTTLTTEATDLQTRLAAAEANITALQTSLAQCQSDVALLHSAVATAQNDVAALHASMTSAESSITGLQSGATAVQAQANATDTSLTNLTTYTHLRHDELLFAWDGAGRYLGRFLGFADGGQIAYYVDPATGLAVFLSYAPSFNWLGFASSDCSGSAYLAGAGSWSTASNQFTETSTWGVLDQGTGHVYTPTGFSAAGVTVKSFRSLDGGSCTAGGSPLNGDIWTVAYTISPFTAPVTFAPMTWTLP